MCLHVSVFKTLWGLEILGLRRWTSVSQALSLLHLLLTHMGSHSIPDAIAREGEPTWTTAAGLVGMCHEMPSLGLVLKNWDNILSGILTMLIMTTEKILLPHFLPAKIDFPFHLEKIFIILGLLVSVFIWHSKKYYKTFSWTHYTREWATLENTTKTTKDLWSMWLLPVIKMPVLPTSPPC